MIRLGLRGRMVVATSVVVTLMVVLVGSVTVAVTAAQSAAVQGRLLDDKIGAAQLLAQRGVAPRRIVAQLIEPGVRVVVLDQGRAVAGEERPDESWRVRQARLGGRGPAAGTVVRISVAPDEAERARRQVVTTVVVAGLVALALGVVLAGLAARIALAPLDRMARTAQDIAAGARGRRLGRGPEGSAGPAVDAGTGSELARTATAVDAMLDELEGAEHRARRAEDRMREFVGDAAHELRTPLAGIRSAGEALPHTDDPGVRAHLESLLVREAARAGALVDDLLEISRLDVGTDLGLDPTPVSVLDVAHDHQQRVSAVRPDLRVHVEGTDRPALADRGRLHQIVANLVDNAVRVAGDGGWVTLAIGTDADRVSLDVTDSGPGVAEDDREVIFDRLVRRRGGGRAGLGLPIARGYARALDGDLVCLPGAEHRGACFRLTLPAADPHRRTASARPDQPSSTGPASEPSTPSSTVA